MPLLSIERRTIKPQPTVFVRYTTAREGLAKHIGEGLGHAFTYANTAGLTPTARPFVRYLAMNGGEMTIEVGTPVSTAATGSDNVLAGELPGGHVVVALHGGHYDQLRATFDEVEQWMREQDITVVGGPWESYITDPGAHPDPAEWRTEIYWPVEG